MKRIKFDEIQNSIKNYVNQRNITVKASSRDKNLLTDQTLLPDNIELSIMALNDLALIESSISEYYSYSLNPTSSTEYFKQYAFLKKYIQDDRTSEKLLKVLFPIFVYTCIDLITLGLSINEFLEDYYNGILQGNPNEIVLIEELKSFQDTKDLTKCRSLKNWKENKYRVETTSSTWSLFLKYLYKSKAYLLLRVININLQIILKNETNIAESDDDDNESISNLNQDQYVKPSHEELFAQPISQTEVLSTVKTEKIDIDEFRIDNKQSSPNEISLASLRECINKIRSDEPSRINGACCYYINDTQSCITSSTVSPNSKILSFTNENSSVYLYNISEEIEDKRNLKSGKKLSNSCFTELVGGHSGTIFKSKFTHDSKYLLTSGDDNLVSLWNINKLLNRSDNDLDETDDMTAHAQTAESVICQYSGHLYPVWDVEIFSLLNLFATSSKDSTARLWSFDRIYPLRVYCGHQSDVNCVKFHPNGSYLATGSSDKTVRLWDLQSGDFVRLFSGHRSRIFSLAFSPDGNYLASAGEDKKIKIWDLRGGSLFKELKGHNDIIHALTFDNNSEILCSGGLDKTVKFWDIHQKRITIEPDFSRTGLNNNIQSKNPNSANSNELIRSINLDFSVYSLNCDIQNVFYVTGARTQKVKNLVTSFNSQNLASAESNLIKNEPLLKTTYSINNNQSATVNQSQVNSISDIKIPASVPPQTSLSSSISSTNIRSTINTRRRTAAMANNSQSNSVSQPSSQNVPSLNSLFINNDDLYEV